jgi:glycine hydroxymethyltransferase
MNETINLIASENKLSKSVEWCLTSDLGNRVAEGWIGERIFPGLKYYDEIEKIGINLIKRLLHCDFVDLRPISGTHANMVIFTAFTKPGDTILSFSINNGAHISMSGATPKKMFHLKVKNFVVEEDGYSLKIKDNIDLINKCNPTLVIFGGSVILFYQDIKEIVQFCKKKGIITVFDASHIIGLILGNQYPNPLDVGIDIMLFSTCKTIPGPQHAVIVSSNFYSEKIKRTTFPITTSGHHLHETVGAILTIAEMQYMFKDYSKQVINNAKHLAKFLSIKGFDILFKEREFTETHMFLLKNHTDLSTSELENILEAGNIIVNKNLLPSDKSYKTPSGFRFGTSEVTRIGMQEKEMELIASFIEKLIIKRIDTSIIKKEVIEFRSKFNHVKYSYE